MVGYHVLPGRDFSLPPMTVVEFGDMRGILQGIKSELARFDANREQVIQERLEASRLILQRYSLEEERACCLRTWTDLCPAIQ